MIIDASPHAISSTGHSVGTSEGSSPSAIAVAEAILALHWPRMVHCCSPGSHLPAAAAMAVSVCVVEEFTH